MKYRSPVPKTTIVTNDPMWDVFDVWPERFIIKIATNDAMWDAFTERPEGFIIKDGNPREVSYRDIIRADFVMINGRIFKNRYGDHD